MTRITQRLMFKGATNAGDPAKQYFYFLRGDDDDDDVIGIHKLVLSSDTTYGPPLGRPCRTLKDGRTLYVSHFSIKVTTLLGAIDRLGIKLFDYRTTHESTSGLINTELQSFADHIESHHPNYCYNGGANDALNDYKNKMEDKK